MISKLFNNLLNLLTMHTAVNKRFVVHRNVVTKLLNFNTATKSGNYKLKV